MFDPLKAPRSGFTVIKENNISEVAERLRRDKGSILVAEPKYFTSLQRLRGEFELDFYDSPLIEFDGPLSCLYVERGSKKVGDQTHQTGWENDRAYRLYPKPAPTGDKGYDALRKLFKHHNVGKKYQFEIAFQSMPSHYLLQADTLSLYVPYFKMLFKPAFTHALKWLTGKWNKQVAKDQTGFAFSRQHIEAIVDYAAKDLRTGDVLRHNVQAGQDADAAIGIPLK